MLAPFQGFLDDGLQIRPFALGALAFTDAAAKLDVAKLLSSFGWPENNIMDLGDITVSRG